jgi:hypothetical protein
MLPHLGLHGRRIGVEPIQTLRTFVMRLVDVDHDTLTHTCIIAHLF